jgi:hypothetical protein
MSDIVRVSSDDLAVSVDNLARGITDWQLISVRTAIQEIAWESRFDHYYPWKYVTLPLLPGLQYLTGMIVEVLCRPLAVSYQY